MPDLYAAVPGGMPTGWLKKISLLEKQMAEAQREILVLKRQVKELEGRDVVYSPAPFEGSGYKADAVVPVPVKRGPGRPRKNPL